MFDSKRPHAVWGRCASAEPHVRIRSSTDSILRIIEQNRPSSLILLDRYPSIFPTATDHQLMSSRHVCLRWRFVASLHRAATEPVERAPWSRSAFFSSSASFERQATNAKNGRDPELESLFAAAVAPPVRRSPADSQTAKDQLPAQSEHQCSVHLPKERSSATNHDLIGSASVPEEGSHRASSDESLESIVGTDEAGGRGQEEPDMPGLDYILPTDTSSVVTAKADKKDRRDVLDKAMQQAYAKRQPENLARLWAQIVQYSSKGYTVPIQANGDIRRGANPRLKLRALDPALYTSFMSYFNQLDQPARAIEVWNHMIANNFQPNIQHYGAMIMTLGRKQDLPGILNAWASIDQMGVQRDWNVWAIYINCLMRCQAFKQAFRSLETMAQVYRDEQAFAAARSQAATVFRPLAKARTVAPTIEILNAALGGVVNNPGIHLPRKGALFDRLMAWAESCGLQPNTDTFNIMLKMRAQKREVAELFRTFKQMEENNVQADAYTYSIFVHALMQVEMPKDEQQATVFRVLNLIENQGIAPSPHIYGVIIGDLLKQQNDLDAAKAVLQHMQSREVTITPQIYSMLLTYYFRPPGSPDVVAIDALWQSIQASGAHHGDVLHDQIIVLYAKAGLVGKAMILLQQMSKAKMMPRWHTLTSVVSALVQADQLDRVREIVHDAEQMRGKVSYRTIKEQSMKDERAFWSYIESLDLSVGHVQGHRHIP